MKANPNISRWTTPGPREAVPCPAAGCSDDLSEGANRLPFSFFVAWLMVGGDDCDFEQVVPMQ
jgi:hypothetical protein